MIKHIGQGHLLTSPRFHRRIFRLAILAQPCAMDGTFTGERSVAPQLQPTTGDNYFQ